MVLFYLARTRVILWRIIMYFLRSWKESVAVFVPSNFKLYMLVTIKNAMETCKNLIYYFWWLVLLVFVFEVGCYYPECLLAGPTWKFINSALVITLSFALFMLVRPSIRPKGFYYFEQHARKTFIGFIGLYFLFGYLTSWIGEFVAEWAWHTAASAINYNLLSFLFSLTLFIYGFFFMLPPFVFSVLFYFDSNGSIKAWFFSILRGFIMFLYNFPFCLLSVVACFGMWHGLQWVLPTYGILIFFSFIPFVVSYFKTMYVKRLHDQFSLYYPNE